jgi:DnaJ-class molecular chaperone
MTFYDILGVPQNSTQDQIKKQYRKLSLEFHPDRPTGNATKFKEINEAYENLFDDKKRKQYDQSLQPMPDLFEMLFKDHFSQGVMFQIMKPPPLVIPLKLTLDQSYNGCKVPIVIERWIHDQHIRQLEKETLYLDVPCGIDTNECIIICGKGNMGPDGTLGDIRVMIEVTNPTKMERKGLDLWYTHIITLKESLCGFSFDMEYLKGQVLKINNTPGNVISPYYKKIMHDMGMKRDGQTGNLVIEFNIVFPTSMSEESILALSNLL